MNLPNDFIEKYQDLLGDQSSAFFESFEHPVEKGFRVNPSKAQFVEPLVDTTDPIAYVKGGYFGTVSGRSIVHTSGGVYSQEPSAMYVGAVVNAQPGEVVLDLCAAPGGKSTHIGSQLQGQGLLVANEINGKRAKILAENVERFGLRNTVVTNETPEHLAEVWPQTFDKILVDAPCSGEGMFRKDPEATLYWNKEYPESCANRQKKILISALQMLKPGGQLIYSTCTFSPEEDEQVIAWVLAHDQMLTLDPIQKYPGMGDGHPDWADGNPLLTRAVRLWPHLLRGEGHFIARIQSLAQPELAVAKPAKKKRQRTKRVGLSKEQLDLFQKSVQATFKTPLFDTKRLWLQGVYLHELPQPKVNLSQVHILRNGLNLGVFKKQRFSFDHDLAVSLAPEEFKVVYEVTEADYERYRHGETLTLTQPLTSQKTFGLLTYRGLGFAIGNFVNRQVKNFYPKGLRD